MNERQIRMNGALSPCSRLMSLAADLATIKNHRSTDNKSKRQNKSTAEVISGTLSFLVDLSHISWSSINRGGGQLL